MNAREEGSVAQVRGQRAIGGITGWLFRRFSGAQTAPSRLALVDRITLAPRQSLALVEAEGQRLLVAFSPDGTPAIYALDGTARSIGAERSRSLHSRKKSGGRISW